MRAGAFSNSAHPDDDAKHGRLRNPTGHGGVYKVDGHGRPEPSVGEENSTFLPSHGGRSPRPPLHFLSPWAWPRGPSRVETEHIRNGENGSITVIVL